MLKVFSFVVVAVPDASCFFCKSVRGGGVTGAVPMPSLTWPFSPEFCVIVGVVAIFAVMACCCADFLVEYKRYPPARTIRTIMVIAMVFCEDLGCGVSLGVCSSMRVI